VIWLIANPWMALARQKYPQLGLQQRTCDAESKESGIVLQCALQLQDLYVRTTKRLGK
jgi:hypothetical protein